MLETVSLANKNAQQYTSPGPSPQRYGPHTRNQSEDVANYASNTAISNEGAATGRGGQDTHKQLEYDMLRDQNEKLQSLLLTIKLQQDRQRDACCTIF
jgi:hypothetical protein